MSLLLPRSFVMRQGRITNAQRRALENLWPHYGIDLEEERAIDFHQHFSKQYPLILEIGFGNGYSLLQQAQQTPQCNFIGIDVYPPGVGQLIHHIHEQKLTNIRVVNGDALLVLAHHVTNNSLMGLQIFFPDPWPKKRHHKRRIVQECTLPLLVSKLAIGGLLHLATDWQPYAMEMLALLQQRSDLTNMADEDFLAPDQHQRPTTKYQQRGQQRNHQIFDLAFRRCA